LSIAIQKTRQLRTQKTATHDRRKTLAHYLTKIARLGGYLARANGSSAQHTVMWRGLSRLTDIALGAMVGAEIVGN